MTESFSYCNNRVTPFMDTSLVLPTVEFPKIGLNEFEMELAQLPKAEMPLEHFFAPHQYLRKITMPAGSIVVSRRHKTEHPYIVMEGVADVYDENGKFIERVAAPHIGITKVGTLRVLVIHSRSVWLTSHVTDLTDPDEIVETITTHDNPLLPVSFRDAAFENREALL